jgi:predicted small secreted protein
LKSLYFLRPERFVGRRVLICVTGMAQTNLSLSFSRRRSMTKKIFAALLLTGSLMVAACNTVEGAGRDVQSAGEAVERAVD